MLGKNRCGWSPRSCLGTSDHCSSRATLQVALLTPTVTKSALGFPSPHPGEYDILKTRSCTYFPICSLVRIINTFKLYSTLKNPPANSSILHPPRNKSNRIYKTGSVQSPRESDSTRKLKLTFSELSGSACFPCLYRPLARNTSYIFKWWEQSKE